MIKRIIATGFCLILMVLMAVSICPISFAEEDNKDFTIVNNVEDVPFRCEIDKDWVLTIKNQSKTDAKNVYVVVSLDKYKEKSDKFDIKGFESKQIDLKQIFSKDLLEKNAINIEIYRGAETNPAGIILLCIMLGLTIFVLLLFICTLITSGPDSEYV